MNRLLRQLLAPPDPLKPFGALVTAADAANARGAWTDAEAAYAGALRINPRRDDLWVQHGHVLRQLGRHRDAEQSYRAALEAAPGAIDAALHLGRLLKEDGRPADAIAAFGAGLATDPRRDELRREVAALGGPVPPQGEAPPLFADADELPARTLEQLPRPASRARSRNPASGPARTLAGRLGPGRPRDPIVFLHLHKTGGLTLDDVLAAHIAPARICPVKDDHLHLYTRAELDGFDLLSGHFDVGALRLLGRRARTVSVFREPRARLVSFYRFHAGHALGGRHGVNGFAQMANAMGPEAFFEDERVRRAPEVFNHYLAVFSLTYAQLRGAPHVSVGQVSPVSLERALARVRALDAVAILERFDQGVTLTCARLGLAAPKAVRPRNQTDRLARRMKGAAPPPVAMTPRLEAALADLVRFDEPIYAAAKAEFQARWAAFETETPREPEP